ncbi:MAG: SusC/RagA family TonB-linked outer membrane protein [Flavisolibacter sp.]
MRKIVSLLSVLVLLCTSALAQTRVVSGVIRDPKGAPIPFATILETGTKNGTKADENGTFTITIHQNSSLTVSSSGYSTTTFTPSASGNQVITINSENVNMQEVVVSTFAGVNRQARSLGASTATVSNSELNQARPINPVTGLVGKVSGLNIQIADNGVNPAVRVTLRGNRSILGNNQALIVVDGQQVDNTYLARLNANDIESFQVLKGASASALYGSLASNGVLVVTTKKGTRGGRPIINFSSTVQGENISYMPDLQDRFGSYGGEGYDALLGVHFPEDPIHVYFPYENQSYGPEYNGQMVPLGGPARFYRPDGTFFDSTRMVPYSPIKNGKRDFFNTGITTQNSLSLSTGDATSSMYLSIQHVNVTGTVPKDKQQRDNFRLNGVKQYGKFTANFNMSYTAQKTDVVGNNTNYDLGGYPLYWEILNQPQHVDFSYFKDWQNNPFASPSYYYNAYYGNPYWYIDNDRTVTNNNNFIGNVILSYKFTNWLEASYNIGYTRNDQTFKNTLGGVTFDPYAVTDPWEAGMIASSTIFLQPRVTDQQTYTNSINGIALLSANKEFGKITTKLVLGNQLQKNQSGYVYDNSNSLIIPGLYNINYRQGEASVNQQYSATGLVSVFGDLVIGYDRFLYLHATGRNDWSSKLAEQNRSFFYPDVDASFIFTDVISPLKNSKWLSYGKVRAAWSKVGNISVGPYQLNNVALVGAGFPYGGTAGFTISNNFANPGLKPEFTTQKEGGIELGFLRNRINFEATYYNSLTTNQTVPTQISTATGFASATINVGSMSNKGIELDLRMNPLVNLGPVNWNLGFTFAHNKNAVGNDLPNELYIGNNVYATPGKAYPNLELSDFVRDSATHSIVVDAATGFPSKAGALSTFGTTVAPTKLGITTSFTWKGLTLSAVADAQFGGVIYNAIGGSLEFTGIDAYSAQTGRQPFVIPNSVIKTAPGKYQPNTNVVVNTATTDGEWRFWANTWRSVGAPFVSSSDYWKIREIALTYQFAKSFVDRLKIIQGASFSLSGRNLFMFRPKDNFWTDPEFSTGGTGNAVGTTDYYQTPPTRIFGATLNVTF